MSSAKNINITLKIWRQKDSKAKGQLETYKLMTFLQQVHSWKC